MFADGRTRITLLAIVFITSLMLTFSDSFFSAPDRKRIRSYQPEKETVKLSSRVISSFQNGVMITGVRDAMRVDLESCDRETRTCRHSKNVGFDPVKDTDIPLLNLKISPDKKAISDYLEKQTYELRRSEVYDSRPLVPVTYIMTEQDGDLRVSAMFMGRAESRACDKQGRCLILFQDYGSYKNYVFYSGDGGQNWRWLSQWQMPEVAGDAKIIAVTAPGSGLMVQNNTLYQTRDYGQNWRLLFSMNHRKKRTTDRYGQRYVSLKSIYWHYNGNGQVAAWMADERNDPENVVLVCFNTRTLKTESDLLIPGEIGALDSTTGGEFYFTLTEKERRRQSVNHLNCNGDYSPVLETGGSYISGLYAGTDLLIAELHSDTRVSDDGGQNWNSAAALTKAYGETALFDKWHNRLFYFPDGNYSSTPKGNRDGLEYATSPVQ